MVDDYKNIRLFYEVLKDEYKIEQERNKLLDDKAGKYASLAGFIIMGFTMGLIRINSIILYACDLWSKLVVYILCTMIFVLLVVALYFLSKVINAPISKGLNVYEEQTEILFKQSEEQCYYGLTRLYKQLLIESKQASRYKSQMLSKAYKTMCGSAIVFYHSFFICRCFICNRFMFRETLFLSQIFSTTQFKFFTRLTKTRLFHCREWRNGRV